MIAMVELSRWVYLAAVRLTVFVFGSFTWAVGPGFCIARLRRFCPAKTQVEYLTRCCYALGSQSLTASAETMNSHQLTFVS
jgi:hypothetical protein